MSDVLTPVNFRMDQKGKVHAVACPTACGRTVTALCGRSGRVHGTYSADAWPKFLKPNNREFVCTDCARVSQT